MLDYGDNCLSPLEEEQKYILVMTENRLGLACTLQGLEVANGGDGELCPFTLHICIGEDTPPSGNKTLQGDFLNLRQRMEMRLDREVEADHVRLVKATFA